MTGILLESGIVLVPLGCAALYIIVSSNKLLFVFLAVALALASAVVRLRYHYSSGAQSDLIAKTVGEPSASQPAAGKRGKKSKRNKRRGSGSDSEDGGEFGEIARDAYAHSKDEEIVERSGALLATTVTPESTKYDMDLYGAALSYDHRCFYIDGRPVWVLAADFDYWRFPASESVLDAESKRGSAKSADPAVLSAWKRVLLQYKSMGFNAVRIRFHWGFHSPRKGVYNFAGNRDVNRLLCLCEEMDMLVIACLGPYIGDDVQGGGYPFWLIQRDHIRLRHLWSSGIKVWDDHFAAAEGEWYDQIISMIVGHEVVTKNVRGRGCIVLVQLENHLAKSGPLALPLSLQDETRLLARMARERVIRAPLLTNNLCWPSDFTSVAARASAEIEKRLRSYRIIKGDYRADISGFTASDLARSPLSLDSVAAVTRGDNTPMVAAELYKSGEDGLGSSFSDQIEIALSQGLSAFSLPGFFKLTEWGNFASPERAVAKSLNSPYEAVFEDGTLTRDARTSRLGAEQLALVTYANGHVQPEAADKEIGFVFSLADAPTLNKGGSFALTATLGPRNRGIFVSNVDVAGKQSGDSLRLVASTKEIYTRISLPRENAEAWVCAEESVQSGQLFFLGECAVAGHADVELVEVDHAPGHKFSFVIPKPGTGVIKVTNKDGTSAYVALLSQQALDTLCVSYSTHDGRRNNRDSQTRGAQAAAAAAWGADGILMGLKGNDISVPLASACSGQDVVVISQEQPQPDTGTFIQIQQASGSTESEYSGLSFIWKFSAGAATSPPTPSSTETVQKFEKRVTQWDTLPWKLLPTMADLETMDEINVMSWQRDLGTFAYLATDIGRNGGHVLYRCQEALKPQHINSSKILLQLNARHRCTIWVNGINMSGHETVRVPAAAPGAIAAWIDSLRHPGSTRGPDRWGGTVTYDVTKNMKVSSADAEEGAMNEVVIVVESYGLGTQANGANDARTPRGIIAAYWHGFNLIGEDHDDSEIHDHSHDRRTEQLRAKWEVCGVDVMQLAQPFNSSGFPDEAAEEGWLTTVERPFAQDAWSTRLDFQVNKGVQWWRWQIPRPSDKHAEEPVYLNISGRVVAYVWVNGVLLAKHHSSLAESSVLLRGGLGGQLLGLQRQQNMSTADTVVVMLYGWADHADSSAKHAEGSTNGPAIAVELSVTNRPRISA
ncbi:hypothetical protein GGI12_001177 [Dipsacomyces acuminosporus]|nr:hypothetical protein GGI12_001177 [Dipsacomyces acuminosporus]